MAKYIIDIPDEAIEFMGSCINVFVEPEFKIGDCKRYALRICKDDITPYTEPGENEIRQKVEQEVWELADYMCRMSQTEKNRCFGFSYPSEVTTNLTYQEAKSMFEKWMENENEIRVGDEIYSDGDYEKSVVMEIHGDGSVSVYTKNGCIEHWWNKIHNLKKTGRHFDEIVQLLNKIRGEEE